jgi:hypothetical protein
MEVYSTTFPCCKMQGLILVGFLDMGKQKISDARALNWDYTGDSLNHGCDVPPMVRWALLSSTVIHHGLGLSCFCFRSFSGYIYIHPRTDSFFLSAVQYSSSIEPWEELQSEPGRGRKRGSKRAVGMGTWRKAYLVCFLLRWKLGLVFSQCLPFLSFLGAPSSSFCLAAQFI